MTYRYKLTIEYDGTPFHGFQYQPGLQTIQGELEKAIPKINQGSFSTIYVAGRTDAGVHAIGQSAHVDLKKEYKPFEVRNALNYELRQNLEKQYISITDVQQVNSDFHARFSAVERSYCYKIINRPSPVSLLINRVWHIYSKLDIKRMHKVAQTLTGTHDFTSFRSTECQAKNPIKTLDQLSVYKEKDLILIKAQSKSFLHHQVRNMVGTLKLVGEGKLDENDIKNILLKRDRHFAGPTAPAEGLYLESVKY